jgi:hypothetical protein
MNLSPPLHQQIVVPVDLDENFSQLGTRKSGSRHS